ncbi:type II toxin-antitoxin system HicB family antitoxin [Spiribacter sp. 1M153]|uniref:type II toxin-antitoxin system HicB family antitoxin n=1 Tax=Spiribacter roseus TaxID=1855875 RepID=UPI00349F59CE
MSTMKLDDYTARISYDEDREVFHGRIINIRDVVNFYGATPSELKQEFCNSLDCYLDVCAERGLAPEKV